MRKVPAFFTILFIKRLIYKETSRRAACPRDLQYQGDAGKGAALRGLVEGHLEHVTEPGTRRDRRA